MQERMLKVWMKLLKASVRHKSRKIAKLESKLIQLELERRQNEHTE